MRHFLTLFLTTMLLPLAFAAEAAKPDVVVILCDDFNPCYTGFAGDPDVRTPRLDEVAGQSMVFSNCYTASPVCMPARTGLVTGLYPHSTGCWGNADKLFVSPELTSMFSDNSRAGYATAMIGKTHWFSGNGFLREFSPPFPLTSRASRSSPFCETPRPRRVTPPSARSITTIISTTWCAANDTRGLWKGETSFSSISNRIRSS